jgi:hypothetical protein
VNEPSETALRSDAARNTNAGSVAHPRSMSFVVAAAVLSICTLAMPYYTSAQSVVATPGGLEVAAGAGRETRTQEALDRFDPYRRELDDRGAGLERRYGYDDREMHSEANLERGRSFEGIDRHVGGTEFRDRGTDRVGGFHEGSFREGGFPEAGRIGGAHIGGGHSGGGHR